VGKRLRDRNDILQLLKSKSWDPCVPFTFILSLWIDIIKDDKGPVKYDSVDQV